MKFFREQLMDYPHHSKDHFRMFHGLLILDECASVQSHQSRLDYQS